MSSPKPVQASDTLLLALRLSSDTMADTSVNHTEPTPQPAPQEGPRWHELVSQVGRELAEPLTAALERITTLTATGRIDRAGLRALRDEIGRARQTGIHCQQIARLASGHIRQSHERVHLTHTLQSALAHRARELHHHGITVTQALRSIEVQADASMLFSLINSLIDWWMACAQGLIEVHVDLSPWPEQARIVCQIRHRPTDHEGSGDLDAHSSTLDTMNWHVL